MIYSITFVGDEFSHGNDSLLDMSWSKVLRVRTIHISSPILAAKSPFFYEVRCFTMPSAAFLLNFL